MLVKHKRLSNTTEKVKEQERRYLSGMRQILMEDKEHGSMSPSQKTQMMLLSLQTKLYSNGQKKRERATLDCSKTQSSLSEQRLGRKQGAAL